VEAGEGQNGEVAEGAVGREFQKRALCSLLSIKLIYPLDQMDVVGHDRKGEHINFPCVAQMLQRANHYILVFIIQ
jgi:hypothetical protein